MPSKSTTTQTNGENRDDSLESDSQSLTELAIPIYQAIKPPSLTDTTREACSKFGMDYRRYKSNVEQRNASSNTKIHLISMKECINERLFQRLWRYGMRLKTEEEATEAKVAEWIKTKTKITHTHNLLEIESNLRKKVSMDPTIVNMEDRLESLLGNFTDYLADHGVCELYLENSQKQAIKLLQNLLEPKVFRDQVKKDLEMDSKQSRENWYTFVTYLLNKGKDMDKVRTCFNQDQRKTKQQGNSSNLNHSNKHKTNPTQKSEKGNNYQKKNTPKSLPDCLNPLCKEKHFLKNCSNTSAEKKKELLERWIKKKEEDKKGASSVGNLKQLTAAQILNNEISITLENKIEIPVALDNGADVTVISKKHFELLEATGIFIYTKKLSEVLIFNTVSETPVHAEKECRLNINLNTKMGSIAIKQAQVYIINEDIPEMLFGKPLLNLIGIDISDLISNIAKEHPGKTFDGNQAICSFAQSNHLYKLKLNNITDEIDLPSNSTILQTTHISEADLFYQEPEGYQDIEIGVINHTDINEALSILSNEANIDPSNKEKLYSLFLEYQDIFHLKLGKDPPASVEPRKLIMQEGAQPKKCTARKYPEAQRLFMEEECSMLEKNGMIYENDKSSWCSNSLVVPKGNGFRLVNDARVTNAQIMHVQWPMPILEVCLMHLTGKQNFCTIDLFKGYWQFPLHPDSQEYFSLL